MSGTVNFFNGSVLIGTGTVTSSGGTSPATVPMLVSSLPGGTDVVTAVYSGDSNFNQSISGTLSQTVLPVVANGASQYGAGWSLKGTSGLIIGSAGVAIVDYGTCCTRYFTGTGPTYTSPANDQGTLVKNMGGSYTYTSKNQVVTNYDSSGKMTSQVDPHGLTQTLGWSGTLLQTITQPDGGVATFGYNGSNLLTSVQEPGGRFLTLSYDLNNNLTGFVDAAGGLYTFGYSASNQLINEQVGPLNTTYTYSGSNGTVTQVDRGLGTTLSLTAAVVQGLGIEVVVRSPSGWPCGLYANGVYSAYAVHRNPDLHSGNLGAA
jgi:YD repeat-containing protein